MTPLVDKGTSIKQKLSQLVTMTKNVGQQQAKSVAPSSLILLS